VDNSSRLALDKKGHPSACKHLQTCMHTHTHTHTYKHTHHNHTPVKVCAQCAPLKHSPSVLTLERAPPKRHMHIAIHLPPQRECTNTGNVHNRECTHTHGECADSCTLPLTFHLRGNESQPGPQCGHSPPKLRKCGAQSKGSSRGEEGGEGCLAHRQSSLGVWERFFVCMSVCYECVHVCMCVWHLKAGAKC